jgi:molybdenum cofactor cytidylyltransferase
MGADAESLASTLVVLAGGASTRMGEPKGLVKVRGRVWIDVQLGAYRAAGGARVVVALGYAHERYMAESEELRRVSFAINARPERGPFSSLACALALVDHDASLFVLPVDVPCPGADVWRALERTLAPAAPNGPPHAAPVDVCVPVLGDRGGHPVLLSRAFVAHLRTLELRARLDNEIRKARRVERVPVTDPRVRMNLNAPEDWAKVGLTMTG